VAKYEFYSQGNLHRLSVMSIEEIGASVSAAGRSIGTPSVASRGLEGGMRGTWRTGAAVAAARKSSARATSKELKATVPALRAQDQRLGPLFHTIDETELGIVAPAADAAIVIVTDTVVLDGARKSDITQLRNKFGLRQVREGLHGKVLLTAPEGGPEGRKLVFAAATAAQGDCTISHVPNSTCSR
jgi:hypothetical protein